MIWNHLIGCTWPCCHLLAVLATVSQEWSRAWSTCCGTCQPGSRSGSSAWSWRNSKLASVRRRSSAFSTTTPRISSMLKWILKRLATHFLQWKSYKFDSEHMTIMTVTAFISYPLAPSYLAAITIRCVRCCMTRRCGSTRLRSVSSLRSDLCSVTAASLKRSDVVAH